jgi:hypothetical protein
MKAVGANDFAPRARSGAVDSQGARSCANAAAIDQSGQTKKETTGGDGEAMELDALGLESGDPCGKLSVPGRRAGQCNKQTFRSEEFDDERQSVGH